MTQEQIIAKARVYAQESAGAIKIVGSPRYRAAAVVYFRCERNRARVEVIVDTESGEFISSSFIPDDSQVF